MKKKIIIPICLLVLAILITLVLVNRKTYYTVSFNTNGGSTLENITILKGNKIDNIEVPIKEGYIFKGWLYNNEDFDKNMKITKDIILIASYEEDKREYTCEKGYTLKGFKCEKKETVSGKEKTACPENYEEIDKRCLNINETKEPNYTCPNNGVHYEGKKCLYGFLEEYPTKDKCEDRGHTYKNGKCYQAVIEMASESCASGYVKHDSKCVKTAKKVTIVECKEGYIAEGTKCVKVISVDAKLK